MQHTISIVSAEHRYAGFCLSCISHEPESPSQTVLASFRSTAGRYRRAADQVADSSLQDLVFIWKLTSVPRMSLSTDLPMTKMNSKKAPSRRLGKVSFRDSSSSGSVE